MAEDLEEQRELASRAPGNSQNWVPVWPPLDQDTSGTAAGSKIQFDEAIEPRYARLEVSSLSKRSGERTFYRQLRMGMVREYFDFYCYEESEQGPNMWSRESQLYNNQKFKMGKAVITEKDLEGWDQEQTIFLPQKKSLRTYIAKRGPYFGCEDSESGISASEEIEDHRTLKEKRKEIYSFYGLLDP